MKNILCYGDSNTWGQIPGVMNRELHLTERFEKNIRWTGVLQSLLGSESYVIEAGLNGRNTSFDETEVIRPSRNGLATLPLILEMNYPLDLVIIMLGTNDAKIARNVSVEQTTQGMRKLIQCVKSSHFGKNYNAPNVMVIAPAPIFKVNSPEVSLIFNDESMAKTKALPKKYFKLAQEEKCLFLNAAEVVKISDKDGVHIEKASQFLFAKAIAEKIRENAV